MVLASLDESKTQTRRIAKGMALAWLDAGFHPDFVASAENRICPFGLPGDQLWVREAWRAPLAYELTKPSDIPPGTPLSYEADGGGNLPKFNAGKLRPSMFMPRWASRLSLEITGVRVERLQEISQVDAIKEGISTVRTPEWDHKHFGAWRKEFDAACLAGIRPPLGPLPRESYRALWEEINGPGSWDLNPWVWVVSFRKV